MSLVRRQAPFVVAVVLLTIWIPAAVADTPATSGSAHAKPSSSQCVFYDVSRYAEKVDFRLSPFGAIGFMVSAKAGSEGIAITVVIDPSACGVDTLRNSAPPLPSPLDEKLSFLCLP